MYGSGSSLFDLITVVAVLIFSWVGARYAKHKLRHPEVTMTNSPILLGYYTTGVDLLPLKKGKLGDFDYTAIAAIETSQTGTSNGETALLYSVSLPFATKTHILAIPKRSGVSQIKPSPDVMEKVELEGNYSRHFNLYCEKGMQTDTRYALDPKAMVFTLDFCQSHSWEIVGNQLYFVQGSSHQAEGDTTFMKDDLAKFVDEVRPAFAVPMTEEQMQNLAPYGVDIRRDYKCPACDQVLAHKDDFYQCAKCHGILLSGSKLQSARQGSLKLPYLAIKVPTSRPEHISCPACGQPMSQQLFGSINTIIDTCGNCPYRWLDGGEKIKRITQVV